MTDLLRFLACGSVDDGKSTLIGRLLLETNSVPDDQRAALERDSRKYGTVEGGVDPALLLDGLQAEREQGITIDVAYRYFRTARRSFIVADAPGHEQYTRNMVTGASTAELAVLLVDAGKGLTRQTRRHACLCTLLGIRQLVLAINKIDGVEDAEAACAQIERDAQDLVAALRRFGPVPTLQAIPVSARRGDNVASRSTETSWYAGPTLLECLETVPLQDRDAGSTRPFRFPVQLAVRPDASFRGSAGTVADGRVRPGDRVVVAASGVEARISRIVTAEGDRAEATAGTAVTLTLDREVDVGRGDLLAAAEGRPLLAEQLVVRLIWLGDEPMLPGRSFLLKSATDTVPASITALNHRIDVETMKEVAAQTLGLNEIGHCHIAADRRIAFDPYAENRTTGAFILIDRLSNATVAAGMILGPLARAQNLAWAASDVTRSMRAQLKGQKPCVVWFTGLSGAGKSTVANLADRQLASLGRHTALLDGDNIRHGLNRDLGFSASDRVENIRRVAEVARLMADAGLIVLVAFISPFRAEREMARRLMPSGEFFEVFVDTPIELCRARDSKGLYAKADRGELPDFTGVSSPYEAPEAPDLRLPPGVPAEEHARMVVQHLDRTGRLVG